MAATALFQQDVLVAPVALLEGRTLYERLGDGPAYGVVVVTVGLLAWSMMGARLLRRGWDLPAFR